MKYSAVCPWFKFRRTHSTSHETENNTVLSKIYIKSLMRYFPKKMNFIVSWSSLESTFFPLHTNKLFLGDNLSWTPCTKLSKPSGEKGYKRQSMLGATVLTHWIMNFLGVPDCVYKEQLSSVVTGSGSVFLSDLLSPGCLSLQLHVTFR